jgi:hypothetical protein
VSVLELRQLQWEFAMTLAEHIWWLNHQDGYKVTLGEAWRSPEECMRRGHENSCHAIRLAQDLNLFQHGVYLKSTEDHRFSGDMWITRHPAARWGGDYGDGNHYSFEWRGRR